MANKVKVYLEGLSLPQPGTHLPLVLAFEADGTVKRFAGAISWPVGVAIEIPSHCELVDLDEVHQVIRKYRDELASYDDMRKLEQAAIVNEVGIKIADNVKPVISVDKEKNHA